MFSPVLVDSVWPVKDIFVWANTFSSVHMLCWKLNVKKVSGRQSYLPNLLAVAGFTKILAVLFPIPKNLFSPPPPLPSLPPPNTKLITFPVLQKVEVIFLPKKTLGASVSCCLLLFGIFNKLYRWLWKVIVISSLLNNYNCF